MSKLNKLSKLLSSLNSSINILVEDHDDTIVTGADFGDNANDSGRSDILVPDIKINGDPLKTFDKEIFAPRYLNLYQTVEVPNFYNLRVIEHCIKLKKKINGKKVLYELVCYRSSFDIGTFTIAFNIYIDDHLTYFINYPFFGPQFVKLVDWMDSLSDQKHFEGNFDLIMGDSVKVYINDNKYYVLFSNTIKDIDLKYLELNKNDYIGLVYQLGVLSSKVAGNPSVFDNYREYE